MNKNDLIDALTPRLGDRSAAALAVESVVDVVLREVAAGGAVGITGFGTFEPVDRAPRTGRNPHTGEAVPIPATRTPRFRPGTYFKDVVADPQRLPDHGLAGARVGSADDESPAATPRAAGARSRAGSREPASQGAPATIRRAAGATTDTGDGRTGTATRTARQTGRRRSGTPATVKADRATPQPQAPEPRPERKAGRRMTIGGEQITQEMISAKKAQLARAKDDNTADGTGTGRKGKDKKLADKKPAGRKAVDKKAADKKKNDKKKGKKGKRS